MWWRDFAVWSEKHFHFLMAIEFKSNQFEKKKYFLIAKWQLGYIAGAQSHCIPLLAGGNKWASLLLGIYYCLRKMPALRYKTKYLSFPLLLHFVLQSQNITTGIVDSGIKVFGQVNCKRFKQRCFKSFSYITWQNANLGLRRDVNCNEWKLSRGKLSLIRLSKIQCILCNVPAGEY